MATHSSLQSDSTTDLNPGGKPEEVQFAPSVENGKSPASTTSKPETQTSSTNDHASCQGDRFPKFLVMQSVDADKPLTETSVFMLSKIIRGLTGPSKKNGKTEVWFPLN